MRCRQAEAVLSTISAPWASELAALACSSCRRRDDSCPNSSAEGRRKGQTEPKRLRQAALLGHLAPQFAHRGLHGPEGEAREHPRRETSLVLQRRFLDVPQDGAGAPPAEQLHEVHFHASAGQGLGPGDTKCVLAEALPRDPGRVSPGQGLHQLNALPYGLRRGKLGEHSASCRGEEREPAPGRLEACSEEALQEQQVALRHVEGAEAGAADAASAPVSADRSFGSLSSLGPAPLSTERA